MSHLRLLLLGIVVIELLVGVALILRQQTHIEPLLPDLSSVDPITASEFRQLAETCQTADAWAKLGEAYLVTGFFPEAEACFGRSAALEPSSAGFAFKHAFALERIGAIEEANARYRAAIKLNHPRADDCRYHIGRNYLRLEQSAQAIEVFRQSSALPASRYELALLDAREGRLGEAEAEAARLAREFQKAYPPASLRYRLALARNDQPAADVLADQFFRRPAPLPTPFDTEVNWVFTAADGFGRARLFRDAGQEAQAGRFSVAEAKLREALAARWEPAVVDRLAEVAFVLGRREEAAQILTEVVQRGGPSSETLWRLGQTYAALGQSAQALAAWERAARLASGPRARDLWHDLATRYEKDKQPTKAKPLFARARLLDGEHLLETGRWDDAVKAFQQAVETDPRLARGWFGLGEAHRFARRADQARIAYDRCLKIDPDYGRAIRARQLLEVP